MTVSVVLRLAEQALAAGRLAGEAEVVETGERTVVRDADGLVRFLGSLGSPSARDDHLDGRGDEGRRG
jgi:hypothetical protein